MVDKNELQAKERLEFEDILSSSRSKFSNLIVRGGECDKVVVEDFFKIRNPEEFKANLLSPFPKAKNISQTTDILLYKPEYMLLKQAYKIQDVFEQTVMNDVKKVYKMDPTVDIYSFYTNAMQQGNVQIVDEMMKEKEQGKEPLTHSEKMEKFGLREQVKKEQRLLRKAHAQVGGYPMVDKAASEFDTYEEFIGESDEIKYSSDLRRIESAHTVVNSIFPKIRKEVGAEVKGYLSASTRGKLNESRGEKSGAVIADKIVEVTKGKGSKYPDVGQSLAEQIAHKMRSNISHK